ncbi:MAG: hypothetical protein HFH87_02950 [Lachnospiraceae bacterium]|nr:hypothetical protein [Lachnospiraceae bacterium]
MSGYLTKSVVSFFSAVVVAILSICGSAPVAELPTEPSEEGPVFPGGDWADERPQTGLEQYQEMLMDPDISEEEIQQVYDKMFIDFESGRQKNDVMMKIVAGGDLADDKPQTAEEQYQEMLVDPDISEEELQKFYDKMFVDPDRQKVAIKMEILALPYYRQERDYYCGPATVQQTLQCLTGSSEDQKTIWHSVGIKTEDGRGAEGDRLRKYVNSNQDINIYGLKYPSSASEMSQDIYDDLSRGVPVILWLKLTEGGNWLYTTRGGHFMNASGINTGGSLIEVTDPNIGWVEGHHFVSGKYWVTAEEAYDATVARGMGYYK